MTKDAYLVWYVYLVYDTYQTPTIRRIVGKDRLIKLNN